MLRYYTIFNLEQVDGIEAPIEPETEKLESIAAAEKIVFEMQNRPMINEAAGNKACYYLSRDEVQMPFFQDFDESEKYYSVLFHEIAHSTGHQSRISRPEMQKGNRFGSDDYSKEELIAEMTAAFLCGESGILPATVENSVAYLQSWSAKFKEDSKMVVCAAAAAQRAADYILNRSFTEQN
jgi:antirestriction protein ArdC